MCKDVSVFNFIQQEKWIKHQIFWFVFGWCRIRTSVEKPTLLFEVMCDFIQYIQANSEKLRRSISIPLRNISFETQYAILFVIWWYQSSLQPYTCTLHALGRTYIKCIHLYISFLKDNLNISSSSSLSSS